MAFMNIWLSSGKNITTAVIAFSIMLAFFFASCEKEETSDFVKVAEVASTHLGADLDATYLFSILHKAIYDTALIRTDTSMIDSAWVYRSTSTLSNGTSYLFDYGDSTVSPDFNLKSGQIEAMLDSPFSGENATIEATFDNYTVNNFRLEGSVSYKNLGEMMGGGLLLMFESDIFFYKEDNLVLDYSGSKTILWKEGFDQTENVEIQVFEISGTSESTYSNPENPDISQAEIAMEIVDVIDVSFDCHKIVKYGKVLINETIPGFNESLTGDFIDSDVDGCSDKVMIKNEQNFGYPYYF